MRSGVFKPAVFLAGLLAAVVGVDIAPDAARMLLARGGGETDVRIENVYYMCVNGKGFAMVRNGKPENTEDFDVVETEELNVYVPKSMSFEEDKPQIVTFPRRTGRRDVGVSNSL